MQQETMEARVTAEQQVLAQKEIVHTLRLQIA